MKKRQWRRIARTDRFTVHQAVDESSTFSVRWKKKPGNYGERVYQARSQEEALLLAAGKAGFGPVEEHDQIIPLGKAFGMALKASRRGEKSRQDWTYAVKRFATWLAENHGQIENWNQLSRTIVRDYQRQLQCLSPNAQRLMLQPITQTDRYIASEYGLPRIAEGLKLSAKCKTPPAKIYLPDVLDLISALPPLLATGVALHGLAGLRIQEGFALTWDRIDLHSGLIEISGQTKNDWSTRVIPICSTLSDLLQALPQPKVRAVTGGDRVFARFETWSGYSRTLAKAIREWNSGITWAPKDLRNCLPTWARGAGHRGDILEEYLGHAPRGVTDRHYVPRLGSVSRGEQEALEAAMDIFRARVTAPLEAEIAALRTKTVPPFSTRKASGD